MWNWEKAAEGMRGEECSSSQEGHHGYNLELKRERQTWEKSLGNDGDISGKQQSPFSVQLCEQPCWKGVQRESSASVKYRLGVYVVTLAADSKGCLSSHVSLEGGCESTRVRGEPDAQRQVVLRGRDWRGPVA